LDDWKARDPLSLYLTGAGKQYHVMKNIELALSLCVWSDGRTKRAGKDKAFCNFITVPFTRGNVHGSGTRNGTRVVFLFLIPSGISTTITYAHVTLSQIAKSFIAAGLMVGSRLMSLLSA